MSTVFTDVPLRPGPRRVNRGGGGGLKGLIVEGVLDLGLGFRV